MNNNQWKYRIGTGKMSVILSLGMTIAFGALSWWLHKTDNGAYLFGDILTAIMVVVLIVTAYRLLFYKVLIAQDGFYYQTQIGNGGFHSFENIGKAWLSKGKDHSGHDSSYCNIETSKGKTIRFIVYYSDQKAAAYLVKRVEAVSARRKDDTDERRHLYRIDGKTFGAGQLIVSLVVVAVMSFFDLPLLLKGGTETIFGLIGVGISVYILLYSFLNYFCFLVTIEENGFYYKTTPFNGAFYRYQNIDRCWTVQKIYRRRRSANRQYLFYFYFTDVAGKTRRFLYSDDIFKHEIQVLKDRIKEK